MTAQQDAGRWDLGFYTDVMSFEPGKGFRFDECAIRSRLEDLREAGIRWTGLNFPNLLEPAVPPISGCSEKHRAWLDDLGFSVSSCHYYGPTYSPVGESQAPALKNLRETVETVRMYKPRALVLHAAWISDDSSNEGNFRLYREEVARHGAERVLRTIADNLREIADVLARDGISLALETLGILLPLGAEQDLPPLIERIGRPNVGYCLDVGHVHLSGRSSAQDWVRLCGDRLFETHFHDNRGPSLKRDEHLPVGFGTISWLDVVAALEEVKFAGPVTFETGGWPMPDRVQGFRQAIAWWRICERMVLCKPTGETG